LFIHELVPADPRLQAKNKPDVPRLRYTFIHS
jgi:hypothetical protein